MTFRIWVALEYLQYLDNHKPQRFDFCIECTPTYRTCQLYHHHVKIIIIYEETKNLVSGAFLKCFSIYHFECLSIVKHKRKEVLILMQILHARHLRTELHML